MAARFQADRDRPQSAGRASYDTKTTVPLQKSRQRESWAASGTDRSALHPDRVIDHSTTKTYLP